ncbi:MAG: hypothetical protein JWL64_2547, partial [Frankiales bacterium]|nr:hypothetical protein [Frankiales bacterium]
MTDGTERPDPSPDGWWAEPGNSLPARDQPVWGGAPVPDQPSPWAPEGQGYGDYGSAAPRRDVVWGAPQGAPAYSATAEIEPVYGPAAPPTAAAPAPDGAATWARQESSPWGYSAVPPPPVDRSRAGRR